MSVVTFINPGSEVSVNLRADKSQQDNDIARVASQLAALLDTAHRRGIVIAVDQRIDPLDVKAQVMVGAVRWARGYY